MLSGGVALLGGVKQSVAPKGVWIPQDKLRPIDTVPLTFPRDGIHDLDGKERIDCLNETGQLPPWAIKSASMPPGWLKGEDDPPIFKGVG